METTPDGMSDGGYLSDEEERYVFLDPTPPDPAPTDPVLSSGASNVSADGKKALLPGAAAAVASSDLLSYAVEQSKEDSFGNDDVGGVDVNASLLLSSHARGTSSAACRQGPCGSIGMTVPLFPSHSPSCNCAAGCFCHGRDHEVHHKLPPIKAGHCPDPSPSAVGHNVIMGFYLSFVTAALQFVMPRQFPPKDCGSAVVSMPSAAAL